MNLLSKFYLLNFVLEEIMEFLMGDPQVPADGIKYILRDQIESWNFSPHPKKEERRKLRIIRY